MSTSELHAIRLRHQYPWRFLTQDGMVHMAEILDEYSADIGWLLDEIDRLNAAAQA